MNKKIFIVAGGTAGHINAAIALGEYFSARSYKTHYITGTRTLDLRLLKNMSATFYPSQTIRFKNPLALIKSLILNLYVFGKVFKKIVDEKPDALLGCGGYVCGPVLIAGYFLKKPIFILEQNAALGLTNKILSRYAHKIFLNFKKTIGIKPKLKEKVVITGNPIRSSISEITKKKESENHILIFGGSLGSVQINRAVEILLEKKFDITISIIHQVGDNEVQFKNENTNIIYRQEKYIDNMREIYEWSDIIICRAGASSVGEVAIVQKPTLFVPLPWATDNHQYWNAQNLKEQASFPVTIAENHISANELADLMKNFIEEHLNYAHNPLTILRNSEMLIFETIDQVVGAV